MEFTVGNPGYSFGKEITGTLIHFSLKVNGVEVMEDNLSKMVEQLTKSAGPTSYTLDELQAKTQELLKQGVEAKNIIPLLDEKGKIGLAAQALKAFRG